MAKRYVPIMELEIMKDKILEYLEIDDKAKTLKEINDVLKCDNNVSDLDKTEDIINDLVKNGIVHETKKNKYLLMKNCPSLRVGKIDIAKKGYAFLIPINDDKDIFISKENLNGAIEDDLVLIDVFTRT